MVFPLDAPADAFRAAEKMIAAPGDSPLLLMAFEDEIEEFCAGAQAFESREYGVFATEPDIEFTGREFLKPSHLSAETQPIRRFAGRRKQHKPVASAGERVSDLDGAPDSAEDLHMGKKRGDVHPGRIVA